jgi:hypothetical protein
MKVKVIKEFIDVHTKDFYNIGTELTITDERFAEIQKVGNFVEQITEEQPETPVVPETPENEQVEQVEQPETAEPKRTTRRSKK